MDQDIKLLRLIDEPLATTGRIAVECWQDGQWRTVAIDDALAGAFGSAEAIGAEVGLAAPAGADSRSEAEPVTSEITGDESAIDLSFEDSQRALVLLPGSWVWSGLEVIPRAARRQSSAVGYMVEDQLAEDVEDLHFVCHPVEGDLCSVFAIARRKMDALHAQFTRLGWPVIAVIPEFGLLSSAAGQSSIWVDGARVHMWQSPGRGLTINRTLLLPVAESLFAPDEAKSGAQDDPLENRGRDVVNLFGAPEELEVAGLSQLGEVQTHPERVEAALPGRCSPNAAGNLLCGEYKITLGSHEGPWWRKPAIAAAACFVLQLLFFVGAGTYFKVQANNADAQARAIFSEIFPGDTPRADLRRQIAGYLNQASGGSGEFANQLQQLAGVWKTGKPGDLRLQSLRFDGTRGELVLQLRAANLGQLDEVVGKLSNGQYQAELLAANELEDGVSGRIRLR